MSAFQWLQGYEKCRTGWDRFAKPQPTKNHSDQLIDLGGGAEREPLRTGFPETWPWSHIITPNSDGKTAIASELMVDCYTFVHVLMCTRNWIKKKRREG